MSSSYAPGLSFRTILRTCAQEPQGPSSGLLGDQHIQTACAELGVAFATEAHHVWTPALTIWTWLTQCLSTSKSCAAAVARAMVLRISLGLEPCSEGTGAYCKARAKLPVALFRRLALQLGEELEQHAAEQWQWKGRRVVLGDGTTMSGPDTPENQAAYPQSPNQKKGLGFPLIRMVVLLGLATGALVGAALGPWGGKEAGETALLRELLERFKPGDVFVADRAYCSYWLIAALQARGVDVAIRLHQSRHYDFNTGTRLSADDHITEWGRPARPEWMDKPTYHATVKTLRVREVRLRVTRAGYRTREILVATTLLDAPTYTREDIAQLYHHRWRVELSIRDIKRALGMDVLRGQTPEMLRREIWCHLWAYNLVRQVIAQAARARNRSPRQISVTGARDLLNEFRESLSTNAGAVWDKKVAALWHAVGGRRVGRRPGRCEPREVKRRPKGDWWMTKPRAERRAELLANKDNE
jgi:hypothetical protein